MKTFQLRVSAMDRIFYEGECLSLKLPITDGQLGIMANHSPVAAAIVPGRLQAMLPGGKKLEAVVAQGFARFENNDALVLVESIERPEDVEADRAREELKKAKDALHKSKNPSQRQRALDQVARELNRIHNAKNPR
ncbi:MAG: ATP synthase F1 subunit epsilon [Oscillospiraceae bacterium]|nr:ATP synthase F1 subunit epsilon [Oscillospiraceae bacterium]